MTGLTAKGLDALGMPMLAISDEGVDLSICIAEVRTLRVGTGVAVGVHADGALPAGFSPRARGVLVKALAFHPTRVWRRDDRRGNRLGSAA